MNEGLERLGPKETSNGREYEGRVFVYSVIESIGFSSAVKRIGKETLYYCEKLKLVEVPNGVECIGKGCFWRSGVEEASLPSTLREIGEDAFWCCERLKTVLVGEGREADVRGHYSRRTAE